MSFVVSGNHNTQNSVALPEAFAPSAWGKRNQQ